MCIYLIAPRETYKKTRKQKKKKREERRESEEKEEGLQKEACSYAVQNSSKYWYNWITAVL